MDLIVLSKKNKELEKRVIENVKAINNPVPGITYFTFQDGNWIKVTNVLKIKEVSK